MTLSPGVRYEKVEGDWIDFASDDTNTKTNGATGEIDEVVPGVGMTYELSETTNAFGGVYKGISTPSPRGFLKSGTGIEESTGYELKSFCKAMLQAQFLVLSGRNLNKT